MSEKPTQLETRDAAPADRPEEPVYPIEPAGFFRRLWAGFIDIGLIIMLFAVLHWFTDGRVAAEDAAWQDIFILIGYMVLFTGVRGQTPGKMVAGIIVVDADGRVPGVAAAIPREVAGRAVSVLAFGLGLAWIAFDKKRQGWHDKIAGTYVVLKRAAPAPGSTGSHGTRQERRERRRGRNRR